MSQTFCCVLLPKSMAWAIKIEYMLIPPIACLFICYLQCMAGWLASNHTARHTSDPEVMQGARSRPYPKT